LSHMRRALDLAQLALGSVSPNPPVGAVVVRDGKVVGEGFTQPAGQAHAEIVALTQAGDQAKGATMFVTLEPCRHTGRTPPCTQAIIQAGIKEVRYSITDPNPRVNGKSSLEMKQGNVNVVTGEEEEASRKLIEAYLKFTTTGLPFITVKFAASLDGKIATRESDSRWITGERARREAHRLRAASDAVMVGIGTVLTDDPLLTARDGDDQPLQRQPLRIVVDSRGRTPATARLLKAPGTVLVAGASTPKKAQSALAVMGAETIQFPHEDGTVDLKPLVAYLGQRDLTSLLVEGGSTLLGAFFDMGLVDKVVTFIASVIVGGKEAVTAVGGLGSSTLANAMRLRDVEVQQFDDDLMVTGYPVMPGK
jgi:diaminohydroxyphosphoribosylaminopyrimidine deaminase/5-amino-6-(5-phosphoribosylamino)uracil reductase